MKISELLYEAKGQDYSPVIDQLEQTPEFREFSKYFDLTSTKIQRKNGSLQISTKPEVLKEPRNFFVNVNGNIKVKNGYALIWVKAGYGAGTAGSLEMYKNCLDTIHKHFTEWFTKRRKNAKYDFNNLNLKTLVGLTYPTTIKEFSCAHNHLTSLEGAPSIPATGDFNCSDNLLTSPLTNTPPKCRIFSVQNNKLTSFEGFTPEASYIHFYNNPFTSFSDVYKHVKSCGGFTLPLVKTGVLAFFKVKDCKSITFYNAPSGSDFARATVIVNWHLATGDLFACQEELIDHNLKDFAEL